MSVTINTVTLNTVSNDERDSIVQSKAADAPLENAADMSAKRALLVMVHGTPRPVANEEMFRVIEVVKKRGVYPIVEVGFMECNAPSIPESIESCIAQGATKVTAVPYFLHTGTHVADDLPTLIEAAQEQYPEVEFAMGGYLGRSELLTDILEARTRAVYAL